MTQERWEEIVGMIKDRFTVLDERTEGLDAEDGPGSVQTIEFEGPAGRMQLTWTTRPRVIDKKALGSRRIGSQTGVQYIYSETEQVHRFQAFRWDAAQQNFVEMTIDAERFHF